MQRRLGCFSQFNAAFCRAGMSGSMPPVSGPEDWPHLEIRSPLPILRLLKNSEPELCFHSICPLSFFVAVAFVEGETSDTLGGESASQPLETKIVKEKKRENQIAHCAQNSQASGECDEGQVLNAKTVPGLHEWGRSCAQQRFTLP